PEHQRAERTHEEAGGISGERGKERRGLVARREKECREEWRQHRVQIEVVPLEHRAERRCEDDAPLFGAEAAHRFFFEHAFGFRHFFSPSFWWAGHPLTGGYYRKRVLHKTYPAV